MECEDRIPIRYGFRPGAIAIRNSMNTSIRYVTLHFKLRHRNRVRLLNSSYVRTEFLSAMVFVPAQKIAIRNSMNTSIRYVTLHLRLRHRNRAKLTVLTCEQKP